MLVSLIKKIGIGRRPGQYDGPLRQDGKRPGEGPPDLEQVWRDFNQRISRLFGQKGPGGDGGNNNNYRPDMKGVGVTAAVGAVVVLFIWLASGFFIVQEGQQGVVLTFGRYHHTATSGLNWRWPYPFQSAETVNVSQVRTVEIGYKGSVKNKLANESLMLTDDENIIDIQFAVQYKLKNAQDWLFRNRDQEETLRQVAETAIREVVGRSKMDFVLYEGREKVAYDVHQLMQQMLDRYSSGASVTNVTMQGVQPPEQVQSAFDDAVKARQDHERQKNEGQAYAKDVIPKARAYAFRMLQEAEAYRASVTENATGNASRFQQVQVEYAKAPGVTRDRMYLETMQQIFSSTSKVMIDAKSGSNMLYLPLDKLMAQSVADNAPKNPAPAAVQESMQVLETTRARDTRSRDTARDRETR